MREAKYNKCLAGEIFGNYWRDTLIDWTTLAQPAVIHSYITATSRYQQTSASYTAGQRQCNNEMPLQPLNQFELAKMYKISVI